jgi:hypothetical protein
MTFHVAAEMLSMSAALRRDGADSIEQAWREALVEVEHLRQQYVAYLRATDRQEEELARLWLQLWRAERRRDELYRRME